jgi:Pyruvate/2-oxoacid:ferredoxin oxidoreductase gamma subunit
VRAINAALVGAGVGVTRLEPVRQSLEEQFLAITSTQTPLMKTVA